MKYKNKIHFSYEPNKPELAKFASKFTKELGQVAPEKAEYIVSLGGDGSLLYSFKKATNNQKCFGVILPNSNSRGFWTNRAIANPKELVKEMDKANIYEIHPLKAEIAFKNGNKTIVNAFNEVAPQNSSGQSMLVNLEINSDGNSIGPIRIMGDGLIISTAFGSTAINRTYGGPAIDIRNSGIILTGKGIYEPDRGFSPIVATANTEFKIDLLSPNKRPVNINYDGEIITSDKENPMEQVVISQDNDKSINLMLTDTPSTRAFAAMI